MRTRAQDSLSTSFQRNTDYNPNGSQSSTTLFASASKSDGERNVITDISTPRFNVLKSNGVIVMNPLQLSKDKRETNRDSLSFGPHPIWGTRVVEGTLACQWCQSLVRPAWFDTRVADAKAAVIVKAHAKIEAADFEALITSAEARETLLMLKSPFKRSLELISQMERKVARHRGLPYKGKSKDEAYRSLTRSKKMTDREIRYQNSLANDLKQAAEAAWLETRLGWKPVIYDITNALKAWTNRNDAHDAFLKPIRKVVRSMEMVEWTPPNELYSPSTPPGLTSVLMSRETAEDAKISSGVLYELRDEDWGLATRRHLGLTLSNVPATAWELMTLSFVVDRFALVGQWLEAMTPKPGVKVLGSWTTVVERRHSIHKIVDAKISLSAMAPHPAVTYSRQGGRFSEVIHKVTRVANPLLPILPPINNRVLDWQQHTDHVALITSRLVKLRY